MNETKEAHPSASEDGLGYLIWWHKKRLEQTRAGLIVAPWGRFAILENEVRIAESFKEAALLGHLPVYKVRQLELAARRLEAQGKIKRHSLNYGKEWGH